MLNCFKTQENASFSIKLVSKRVYIQHFMYRLKALYELPRRASVRTWWWGEQNKLSVMPQNIRFTVRLGKINSWKNQLLIFCQAPMGRGDGELHRQLGKISMLPSLESRQKIRPIFFSTLLFGLLRFLISQYVNIPYNLASQKFEL